MLFPSLKSSNFSLRRGRRKPLCLGSCLCWLKVTKEHVPEGYVDTKGGPSPCPHGPHLFSLWHKPVILFFDITLGHGAERCDLVWEDEAIPGAAGAGGHRSPLACPGSPRMLSPLSREGDSFQEMAAAFRSWDHISSLFLRTGSWEAG